MKTRFAHEQLHNFQAAISIGYPAPQHAEVFRLLQACLHFNNEATWSDFLHRTQPLISCVIAKSVRRRTGTADASLVDDLIQETYLKLCTNNFKSLREFECHHENALFGFLKVVASNVAHDYFRGYCSQKRGRGQEAECLEDVPNKAVSGKSVEQHLEQRILLREIDSCLKERHGESTSSRDAIIFWLYYRDGLTARAIAKLPEIRLTVKGVESTIHRLTRRVRIRLKGHRKKRN